MSSIMPKRQRAAALRDAGAHNLDAIWSAVLNDGTDGLSRGGNGNGGFKEFTNKAREVKEEFKFAGDGWRLAGRSALTLLPSLGSRLSRDGPAPKRLALSPLSRGDTPIVSHLTGGGFPITYQRILMR